MALEAYLEEGNEKKLMMLITKCGQLERDLFPHPMRIEPFVMAQKLTEEGFPLKADEYLELRQKIDDGYFNDIYRIGEDFENGATFITGDY